MAITQAYDMRQWYTRTKELQLASLQLCEACRRAHTVHLRVDADTPTTLLAAVDACRENPERGVRLRVPRVRARRVTWKLPSVHLLSESIDAFVAVEELHVGKEFKGDLDIRRWPSRLKKMEFGIRSRFNQPILGVAWPASLQKLCFGPDFNQPILGVVWPGSLQQLGFGLDFNQPIERVTWPASLQRLTFPGAFNQKIQQAIWPESLRHLKLGPLFNQPIEGVEWPRSLRTLIFGGDFNQPIERARLPSSLQHIIFDVDFNQPIEAATWPPSLRQLKFGNKFNQPIEGVTWPPSLRQLAFGYRFNKPIQGVTWPPSLEELSFGHEFNQPVQQVQLPSLRRFSLKGMFSHSLQNLGTTVPSLERFTLLFAYDQARYSLLRGIKWPAGLTCLEIAFTPDVHLEEMSIPPTVSVFHVR